MNLCRFNDDRLGLVEADQIADLSAALEAIPPARWPTPHGDLLIANLAAVCEEVKRLALAAPRQPVAEVSLRSPVANPTKVSGAPVNYHAHQGEAAADEGISFGWEIKTIDEYGLFLKNPVLVRPSEGVTLHFTDRRNDHEVEVAAIIGRECKNVPRARPSTALPATPSGARHDDPRHRGAQSEKGNRELFSAGAVARDRR